jgi:hypothetical protein
MALILQSLKIGLAIWRSGVDLNDRPLLKSLVLKSDVTGVYDEGWYIKDLKFLIVICYGLNFRIYLAQTTALN